MSGAKAGGPALLATALLLPVVGTAAVIGGAGLCVELAARGTFRLGKKTYDLIDEKIEKQVAEDLKKDMALIEEFKNRKNDNESSQSLFITNKAEKEKSQSKVFIELTRFLDNRKELEKKEDLGDRLSREFQKNIDEFKQKLLRDSENNVTGSKENEGETPKQLENMADEIDGKLEVIKNYFPVFADQIKSKMKNLVKEVPVYEKVLKDVNKKINLIADKSYSISVLSPFYTKVINTVGYDLLDKNEKEEFETNFTNLIEIIEKETFPDNNQIKDFEKKAGILLKKCRQKHMDQHFKKDVDTLEDAMREKGYPCLEKKYEKSTLQFIFKQDDSEKQVEVNIKRPEIEDDMTHDFEMKVSETGFENIEERRKEGKAIFRTLKSYGFQMDYIDLDGVIPINANKETLSRQIKKIISNKKMGDIEVTVGTKGSVTIGGQEIFFSNLSINNVVEKYLSEIKGRNTEENNIPEKDRIKITGE